MGRELRCRRIFLSFFVNWDFTVMGKYGYCVLALDNEWSEGKLIGSYVWLKKVSEIYSEILKRQS